MSLEDKRTLVGIRPPTEQEKAEAKAKIEAEEQSTASEREAVNPPQTAIDNTVIAIQQNTQGVYELKQSPRGSEYTQRGTFKMPVGGKVQIDLSPKAMQPKQAAPQYTDKGTVRIEPIPKSAWAKAAEEKSALGRKTTVQVAAAEGNLPSSHMPKPRRTPVAPLEVQQITGKKALAIVAGTAAIVSIAGLAITQMSGKGKGQNSTDTTTVAHTATSSNSEQNIPDAGTLPTATPVVEPTSEPSTENTSKPVLDAGVPIRAQRPVQPIGPRRTAPSAQPKKGDGTVVDPWGK